MSLMRELTCSEKMYFELIQNVIEIWGLILAKIMPEKAATFIEELVMGTTTQNWLLKKETIEEKSIGFLILYTILENVEYKVIPPAFWSYTQVLCDLTFDKSILVRKSCAFGLGKLDHKAPNELSQKGSGILARLGDMIPEVQNIEAVDTTD